MTTFSLHLKAEFVNSFFEEIEVNIHAHAELKVENLNRQYVAGKRLEEILRLCSGQVSGC